MIDIVPTVLDVVGIEKPTHWDGEAIPVAPGKSLVSAFAKEKTIHRDSLWWLHEGNRAIRVGNWKLVAAENDPWELYDLTSDRAEQYNLASKMPDKVKELESVWQDQTNDFAELAAKTLPDQTAGKRAKKNARSGK